MTQGRNVTPTNRRLLTVIVVCISVGLVAASGVASLLFASMLGQMQHQVVADALAGPSCDGQTGVTVAGNLAVARDQLSVSTNDEGQSYGPYPILSRESVSRARQALAPILAQEPDWIEYDSSLAAVTNEISDHVSARPENEVRRKSLQAQLDDLTIKAKQTCERLYSDATGVTPAHVRLASKAATCVTVVTVVWFGSLIGLGLAHLWDRLKGEVKRLTSNR